MGSVSTERKKTLQEQIDKLVSDKIVVSRQEAIDLGQSYYYTNKLCSRQHLTVRHVSDGKCRDCVKINGRNRRIKNKELGKPTWYSRNKTRSKTYAARYYIDNKDAVIQRTVNYKKQNPEKASRRNMKCKPKWLSKEDIRNMQTMYKVCQNISSRFGEHHVDHIVPLKGKTVCGLHVPWNLQILPARKNREKASKYDGL